MKSDGRADPHLWVVAPCIVQQGETYVMEALDLAGAVAETLKHPTADIPWTHQAALNLHWERQKVRMIRINFPALGWQKQEHLPNHLD